MPSALSLFFPLLVVALLARPLLVTATLVVQTSNLTFEAFPDLQAYFGPPIPDQGISGILVLADPLHGCTPISEPEFPRGRRRPWVALLARTQGRDDDCTFDIKVRHAEEAGAAAAIIFDDIYESLIIMAKPPTHPSPAIPSVFISQRSGEVLRRLYEPGKTQVMITPLADIVWMSMILSAFSGFLAVSVVLSAFYLFRREPMGLDEDEDDVERGGGGGNDGATAATRRQQQRQQHGMSQEQLQLLPVIIHDPTEIAPSSDDDDDDHVGTDTTQQQQHEERKRLRDPLAHASTTTSSTIVRKAGDTKRVCAICLEQYEPGDKLRQLPCSHRYHVGCVDPWLSSRKNCPVCKHDATQRIVDDDGDDVEGGGAAGDAAVAQSEGTTITAVRRVLSQLLDGRWAWNMVARSNRTSNSNNGHNTNGSGSGSRDANDSGRNDGGEQTRLLLNMSTSSSGSSIQQSTAPPVTAVAPTRRHPADIEEGSSDVA